MRVMISFRGYFVKKDNFIIINVCNGADHVEAISSKSCSNTSLS